jgi:hypothetical protein
MENPHHAVVFLLLAVTKAVSVATFLLKLQFACRRQVTQLGV